MRSILEFSPCQIKNAPVEPLPHSMPGFDSTKLGTVTRPWVLREGPALTEMAGIVGDRLVTDYTASGEIVHQAVFVFENASCFFTAVASYVDEVERDRILSSF